MAPCAIYWCDHVVSQLVFVLFAMWHISDLMILVALSNVDSKTCAILGLKALPLM